MMSDERRGALWDRLYNMDGIGLADYMNQLYPFTDSSMQWRGSQHGESLFVWCSDGIAFSWSSWHIWREKVSYFFDGFCDAIGEVDDERFCDIAVFYLARILFAKVFEFFEGEIETVDIQCKLILM